MKRALTIILVLLAFAVAGIAYLYLRSERRERALALSDASLAAPSPTATGKAAAAVRVSVDLVHQLPPGATAIVFANVGALRDSPLANELTSLAPSAAQDPEYTQFVKDTGFDYSRDLDRVAVALWPANSPTSVVAVAQGKFDERKIERYALTHGHAVNQGDSKILEVREEGSSRTVRFVFLAPDEIALADGPEISYMLEPNANRLDPAMSQRIAKTAAAPIFAVARTQDLSRQLGIDATHDAQLAEILQSIQNISIAGLPAGANLKIAAAAECDSTVDALKLSTTLNGLLLMGRMALADSRTRQEIGPQWPALDALLKAADISHDSHLVRLHIQITPEMMHAAADSASKEVNSRLK
ncbi:MAG TPA: hypothetical protein VGR81_14745 [Candidatus Acidoferrales bacterium]|nr:hypothetical protein [Candidatus Acidoferrales bacterium]